MKVNRHVVLLDDCTLLGKRQVGPAGDEVPCFGDDFVADR